MQVFNCSDTDTYRHTQHAYIFVSIAVGRERVALGSEVRRLPESAKIFGRTQGPGA